MKTGLLLALGVMGVSALAAGVLLTLGLTGGSIRCVLGRHQPGEIWTSHDTDATGYRCPVCGVLWWPDVPRLNSRRRLRRWLAGGHRGAAPQETP